MDIHIAVDMNNKNWTLPEINTEVSRWQRPIFYILSVFLPLGYLGNCIFLFVNVKLYIHKKTALKLMFIYLSVVELFSSFFLGPILMYRSFFPILGSSDVLCQLYRSFCDFFFLSSLLILLAIAVERYNHICRSLNTHLFIWTSAKILLMITIIATILSMPHGTTTTHRKEISINGKYFTHFCWHETRKRFHLHYVSTCTVLSLSTIILVTLYSVVWYKRAKYRRQLSKSHQNEKQLKESEHPRKSYLSSPKSFTEINVTILIITVLFGITYIPKVLIITLFPDCYLQSYYSPNINYLILDLNWLACLSINPCIYLLCNKRWRLKCRRLFQCRETKTTSDEESISYSVRDE